MAELRRSISPELPPEVLFYHILPRLPHKSVVRFRCVCKQWQSFLKTPTANGHPRLLVISKTTPCTFRTIDCEALRDGLTAARSLPFEAEPQNMSIVASLDGLVCVGIKKTRYEYEKYSDLILWNPSTGEYKTLSRANTDNDEFYVCAGGAFGLYYTSSNDDYQLVRVTYYHDVYIYSLKSDSWRKVDSIQDAFLYIPNRFPYSWRWSVLLNKKLYFVNQTVEGNLSTPPSYSIMRFDSKTEKFSKTEGPTFTNPRTWWLNLWFGCIHLCVTHSNPYFRDSCQEFEMWRMDGGGEWTKVVTYYPLSRLDRFDQPLHVMKNGNWLMLKEGWFCNVDVKTRSEERYYSTYFCKDILLGRKYIETLVSPNQYT
ncbi:LOW QUALITY PROTEIN: hypothetical protein OSB04_010159 [Centaurea solstitialis]|uniref:F-box domain-containing protein n=1 Tax=Centaurea solstitialis TaxID=347529 RepID=A0AA38WKD2_9ASTR|nr:LOW QUALITY PROTEIN: hypothetical protein OSB04_010159 [Centaurea solstitialis]